MASSNAPSVLRKQAPPPLALEQLISSGWRIVPSSSSASPAAEEQSRLVRGYKFKDFGEAWGFMSRVALAAEKLNVRPCPFLCLLLPLLHYGTCTDVA